MRIFVGKVRDGKDVNLEGWRRMESGWDTPATPTLW